MQTITTVSGKIYEVKWCGASTIDYALKFEVVNAEYVDIFTTFVNPEETKKLIHHFDAHETTYYNYTDLKGISSSIEKTIVVALNPKALEDINKEGLKPKPSDEEIQEGKDAINLLNILFDSE